MISGTVVASILIGKFLFQNVFQKTTQQRIKAENYIGKHLQQLTDFPADARFSELRPVFILHEPFVTPLILIKAFLLVLVYL